MIVALMMGSIFILAGLAALRWWRRQRRMMLEAASWPSAPGKVLESRIDRARPDRDESDSLSIVYHFEVDGVTHVGTRIGFFSPEGCVGLAQMEALQRRYPQGSAVRVHYRPGDPRECVLEPGNETGKASGRNFIVLLIGLGVAALVLAPRFG